MNKTLCSSIWNDYSWLWLTSLAFPTAASVSTFQNKTKVIVRYGAVCMCAESVDFSLFIFYGRLQCRIGNCVYSPPGLQRRWGRRVFVFSASPERSHTQRFHGDDTLCMWCWACRNKRHNPTCFHRQFSF